MKKKAKKQGKTKKEVVTFDDEVEVSDEPTDDESLDEEEEEEGEVDNTESDDNYVA